jgi:hypothetical protein
MKQNLILGKLGKGAAFPVFWLTVMPIGGIFYLMFEVFCPKNYIDSS